ncbi:MAG TPA: DNA translocase FtsK [Phycisphaerae bacterium]|nr:DNA translocase FtsK [Phycisphaerae bacterium]
MSDASQSIRRIPTVHAVLVLLVLTFLLAATCTFSPSDWPSTKTWPHPQSVHNACGRIGAWVAYQLFHWIGHGVYPLLLLSALVALRALWGRSVNDLPLRVVGIAVTSVVVATSARMIWPGSDSSLPEGYGGIIGIALASAMRSQFGALGSCVVLLCGLCTGLLLAADDALRAAPPILLWAIKQSIGLRAALPVVPGKKPRRADAPHQPMVDAPPVDSTAATEEDRDQPPAEPVINTGRSRLLAVQHENLAALDASADVARVAREPDQTLLDEPPTDTGEDDLPTQADQDAPQESDAVEAGDPSVDEAAPEFVADEEDVLASEDLAPPRNVAVEHVEDWAGASPQQLGEYELPPLTLLDEPQYEPPLDHESVVKGKARLLERTLADFRVQARVVQVDTGPVVAMYELELAPGVKVSQIHALAHDMARVLKAPAVRVVAPIPGKNTIGVEVPNIDKEKVRLRELLALAGNSVGRTTLPLCLGKDASGNPLVVDLATMPHLLIAGTTGSGKSVCISALVMSILMTQRPDRVKLILVDPKMVELSVFRDVPHLMCPIVTDMQQAEMILDWAATKMDERYELLAEAGVRNIQAYNQLGPDQIVERFNPTTEDEASRIPQYLPHIIIVIDELADLMMIAAKNVEHHLSRLAQKSRAVGIHIIVATQRPQANIVTGLIKSNIPCRIAFRVASRMDSRIVLDQNGAEVLMGAGDMLFLPPGSAKLRRAQGTFVEDLELRRVLDHLKGSVGQQFHTELVNLRNGGVDDGPRDELFDQAAQIVIETRRGSVSLLQRRLTIGYARASRLIDQLAAAGVVGPYKGSQAREVIMTVEQWEAVQQQEQFELQEVDE